MPRYARHDFEQRHPPARCATRRRSISYASRGCSTQTTRSARPPAATADLEPVHSRRYVEALARLSLWAPLTAAPLEAEARRFGLGSAGNPIFPGAHAAAALVVGGSLRAAARGRRGPCWQPASARPAPPAGTPPPGPPAVLHYFHPMSGLHHGFAERASGFCLYKDPAVH